MKNPEAASAAELAALEAGAVDPRGFTHPEHVRFAYGMLERYPFGEAVTRLSRGLKLLATNGGRPEVYHETITVAFLALINERRALSVSGNWAGFEILNRDLFDKGCLERWYGKEQLASDLARRIFCLPSRSGPTIAGPAKRQRRFQIAAP
jgi:hypothetical protein